jgi:hypothetical protein
MPIGKKYHLPPFFWWHRLNGRVVNHHSGGGEAIGRLADVEEFVVGLDSRSGNVQVRSLYVAAFHQHIDHRPSLLYGGISVILSPAVAAQSIKAIVDPPGTNILRHELLQEYFPQGRIEMNQAVLP